MKVILWLLVLCAGCGHVVKMNEQVKITGYKYTGTGYDATTNEYKFPIFKMNFNFSDPSKVWRNPFYPGDDEYVPDELYLTNTPESFDEQGVMIHHMLDNYTREQHYHYSDSGWFSKHTEDIYYYIHRVLAYDNSKGFAYKRIAWYTLELDPLVFFQPSKYFSQHFKDALAKLPRSVKSNDDTRAYNAFINSWGTHYIKRTVMGGELVLNTWLHSCFLEKQTIYWVKEQTTWSFLGIFSWGKMREEYIKKVDIKFLEHVQMDQQSKGGIWKNGTTWEDYKNTLKGDLITPVFYSYEPITDLIDDQAVKLLLTNYITAYQKLQDDDYDEYVTQVQKEKKEPRPNWCDDV